MAPKNWYPSFTSRVSTHMAQLHILTKECSINESESELYHVIDKLLNSTAERRNKKYPKTQGWFLSIGPQPRLQLPEFDYLDVVLDADDEDEGEDGEADQGRPGAAASSRVLRNHVDMLEQSFSTLSISDVANTSVSAVTSSAASDPDPTTNNHRTPDFITYLTTEDEARMIVFIHELKAFPMMALHQTSSQKQIEQSYRAIFDSLTRQVVEQAQYAFANFEQDTLYMMPIVGLKYKIMRFDRDRTPRIGEALGNDHEVVKIPATNHDMKELLNVGPAFLDPRFSDFDAVDLDDAVKRWWTVAISKALKAA